MCKYFSKYRNILGTKTLGDILAERETIAHDMQVSLDEATDPWGVYIERVEVNREHYDHIREDDHYIEHSEVWNIVIGKKVYI